MSESPEKPVYVVLGATGGIGSEVARRLAHTGASLMLGARDADRLASLAGTLAAAQHITQAEDSAGIEACIAQAKERRLPPMDTARFA